MEIVTLNSLSRFQDANNLCMCSHYTLPVTLATDASAYGVCAVYLVIPDGS